MHASESTRTLIFARFRLLCAFPMERAGESASAQFSRHRLLQVSAPTCVPKQPSSRAGARRVEPRVVPLPRRRVPRWPNRFARVKRPRRAQQLCPVTMQAGWAFMRRYRPARLRFLATLLIFSLRVCERAALRAAESNHPVVGPTGGEVDRRRGGGPPPRLRGARQKLDQGSH